MESGFQLRRSKRPAPRQISLQRRDRHSCRLAAQDIHQDLGRYPLSNIENQYSLFYSPTKKKQTKIMYNIFKRVIAVFSAAWQNFRWKCAFCFKSCHAAFGFSWYLIFDGFWLVEETWVKNQQIIWVKNRRKSSQFKITKPSLHIACSERKSQAGTPGVHTTAGLCDTAVPKDGLFCYRQNGPEIYRFLPKSHLSNHPLHDHPLES